ncbi:hypothetical protein GCM10017784_39870 [Deinococcus indicus]|nr:hypothetical protein GCM10017784_39870 [Deinococcus indicus]
MRAQYPRVFTQPLLMHLGMTPVEMEMLIDVIHRTQRQPMMLPGIILGELDVLAVQMVHLSTWPWG